jgi:hypothetical protein
MATLPPLGNPNPKLADALKQFSAVKYGKPRAVVEAEITERLTTKIDSGSTFPSTYGLPGQAPTPFTTGPSAAAMPGPAKGSSFLDEWLSKRKTSSSSPTALPRSPVEQQAPKPQASALSQQNITKDTSNTSVKLQSQAKASEAMPSPPKHEGEIDLGAKKNQQDEDTIFIDKEGNLHSADQP